LDLENLKPNFVFRVPEELRDCSAHYPKDLKDYVKVHNDYINTKILEEKAKPKRTKKGDVDINAKYEFLEFEKEL